MKNTTLVDVSKCTSVNQLVYFTLHQSMKDGTSVYNYIRSLFIGKSATDLARRAMYEYGYSIAYSRLRLLIRTQADDNAFRLSDYLSTDKIITRKQFAEKVAESSADFKQCMKAVREWLKTDYEEKLLTNINHRVKSLVSVDAIVKKVRKYFTDLAHREVESNFTVCFDMVHESLYKFHELYKQYNLLCNCTDLEEISAMYLKNNDYDVKATVKAMRSYFRTIPTTSTIRTYNKQKVYLFDNGLVKYLYSVKADGTKHKLVNITSADVLEESTTEWKVVKQHFLHDDINNYVSDYITSQTRQVKRTVSSTTTNSDGEEQTIFDCLIVDTDNGRMDLAYITTDTEIAIKQYGKYLVEEKKMNVINAHKVVQIIMHKAQGYTMEEIAQIMNVSARTAYRIWQAHKADFRTYLLNN